MYVFITQLDLFISLLLSVVHELFDGPSLSTPAAEDNMKKINSYVRLGDDTFTKQTNKEQ